MIVNVCCWVIKRIWEVRVKVVDVLFIFNNDLFMSLCFVIGVIFKGGL